MKILRVFLILFLLQLATLLLTTSCCEELYTYQWSELFTTNLDNRGAEPIEATESRLPAIAYGIRVNMGFDFVYQKPCLKGFLNSAYATSCAETYTPNDTIRDLRIFALSDFDETHLARMDLSDYFAADKRRSINYYSNREDRLAQAVPFSTFIADLQEKNYDLFTDFDLLLLQEPTLDSVFQFVIEIELASQMVLTDTTESIVLY